MPLPYASLYAAARIDEVIDMTDGTGDAVRISQSCEVAELATLGAKRDVEPEATEVVSLSSSMSALVSFMLE